MIAGAGDKVGDFSTLQQVGPAGKVAGATGKVVGKGVAGMAYPWRPPTAQEKNP